MVEPVLGDREPLDFFTEEKAGVIMTRMTSDIEALNQLFQDGIVNVAEEASDRSAV